MLSAAEHIGSVIDTAENQEFRFDHFMNEALYGTAGFYTSGVGRAGRRGLDKEGNVAGVASEDFIQTMLQHPKVIEAFGNEVSDKFVACCTPDFYEKFVKRVAKLELIEQVKKERIVKTKPSYTQLHGRWGK